MLNLANLVFEMFQFRQPFLFCFCPRRFMTFDLLTGLLGYYHKRKEGTFTDTDTSNADMYNN